MYVFLGHKCDYISEVSFYIIIMNLYHNFDFSIHKYYFVITTKGKSNL